MKRNLAWLGLITMVLLASCHIGVPGGETTEPFTTDAPDVTLTPSETPPPTATFMPEQVSISVSVDTDCRTGPTSEYPLLSILPAGGEYEIEGRNQAGDFWLIFDPAIEKNCWVYGEMGEVTGDGMMVPFENLNLEDPPEDPTLVPGSCTFTFLTYGYCRSGPGSVYSVLTLPAPGTVAPVLGRASPKNDWFKIQLPDVACWVHGTNGTFDCDPLDLPILDIPPTPWVPMIELPTIQVQVPSCSSFTPSDCPGWCRVLKNRSTGISFCVNK